MSRHIIYKTKNYFKYAICLYQNISHFIKHDIYMIYSQEKKENEANTFSFICLGKFLVCKIVIQNQSSSFTWNIFATD